MQLVDDILQIPLETPPEELEALQSFIEHRIEYIDRIELVGERFATSALLQLLHSIKKSNPLIEIPAVESDLTRSGSGTLHWT